LGPGCHDYYASKPSEVGNYYYDPKQDRSIRLAKIVRKVILRLQYAISMMQQMGKVQILAETSMASYGLGGP
jgi:malate synthase